MAEAVIVDQSQFEQQDSNAAVSIIKNVADSDGTDYVAEDIILSDHSNVSSQQETTHNSNHSTPSNSNSNPSPLNMQTESKSNTELSFHDLNGDRESASLDDPPRGSHYVQSPDHDADAQDHPDQIDELINDLINDPDNLLSQIDENEHDLDDSDDGSMVAVLPSSPLSRDTDNSHHHEAAAVSTSSPTDIQQEVHREYRRMLEDESKRLKSEKCGSLLYAPCSMIYAQYHLFCGALYHDPPLSLWCAQ